MIEQGAFYGMKQPSWGSGLANPAEATGGANTHDSLRSQLEDDSRVAHTLPFMYAPHEHAQHPYHRVLAVACPGFLTGVDIKGDVGATRGPTKQVRAALAPLQVVVPPSRCG
jgi:hypothetical protein